MTRTRTFARTLLDMYAIAQEGDLGVWIKGAILDEMFTFWVGAGNGAGYRAGETDKGKAVDVHAASHLKAPIPVDIGLYFRTQVNDNLANPAENTLSITTAGSLDAGWGMFRFGVEGFYHTFNDWLDDGLGNLTKIRHIFYGGSCQVSAAPTRKMLFFLRGDLLRYNHGTFTPDPARYGTRNFLVGGGYSLFKNFFIGASVGLRQVNGVEGVAPLPAGSWSSGYDAPTQSVYWNALTDGEMTFTIHTRYTF